MTIETATQSVSGQAERESSPDLQLVVCVVGNERYGLEVGRVREIIRTPTITALPGAHASVSGVINLRGRVIPIMELRLRLGLDLIPPTRLSRIVVAEARGSLVGLVVDAVNEVVRVAAGTVEPAPAISSGVGLDHVAGIAREDDGLIVLLDLDRLIEADASTVFAT